MKKIFIAALFFLYHSDLFSSSEYLDVLFLQPELDLSRIMRSKPANRNYKGFAVGGALGLGLKFRYNHSLIFAPLYKKMNLKRGNNTSGPVFYGVKMQYEWRYSDYGLLVELASGKTRGKFNFNNDNMTYSGSWRSIGVGVLWETPTPYILLGLFSSYYHSAYNEKIQLDDNISCDENIKIYELGLRIILTWKKSGEDNFFVWPIEVK